MNQRQRSSIGAGLFLILLGILSLVVYLNPTLGEWIEGSLGWPLIMVGVGLLLLMMGLLTGAPGMAVPACIVGGIGGIIWWQSATGDWESWAYLWTLIPGFVGVGTILAGLFGGDLRQSVSGGLWMVLISLVLFAIFGSLFGNLTFLGDYWPALLILLGLLILVQALFRGRR